MYEYERGCGKTIQRFAAPSSDFLLLLTTLLHHHFHYLSSCAAMEPHYIHAGLQAQRDVAAHSEVVTVAPLTLATVICPPVGDSRVDVEFTIRLLHVVVVEAVMNFHPSYPSLTP